QPPPRRPSPRQAAQRRAQREGDRRQGQARPAEDHRIARDHDLVRPRPKGRRHSPPPDFHTTSPTPTPRLPPSRQFARARRPPATMMSLEGFFGGGVEGTPLLLPSRRSGAFHGPGPERPEASPILDNRAFPRAGRDPREGTKARWSSAERTEIASAGRA